MFQHGEWISEFGFYLLLALNVVTLIRMFLPQRRDIRVLDEQPRREELLALTTRVERLEAGLETLRRESRSERDALLGLVEERVVKIHERLNEVLAAVSELKGKVNSRRTR